MSQFIINGAKKLSGQVTVNSSKNAAAATLIGSLINQGETTLKNVPQIEEINRLIEVLTSIGVKITKKNRDLIIQPPAVFNLSKINTAAAKKTRSIILAIGALAGQLKNYSIPQAGGCRLGSRTVKPHLFALENFGLNIKATKNHFNISGHELKPAEFVLYESGDTVTENALLTAAQIAGESTLKFCTSNYMVRDLCYFLQKLGVTIEGVGTSTLKVTGLTNINQNIEYEISEDPIEAMFFISLAATANSSLTIKRCPLDFLELELLKLEKMGFQFSLSKKYYAKNGLTVLADITTHPSKLKALEEKIHALPFPGINQDNLPFFVPIATQAKGGSLIHDWTYEDRAIYYPELNRLGAKITLMDPHRVTINGPTKLIAAEVVCPPALRPAAIILVAMLAAKGKSTLYNVYPIHRGYEKLEERLQSIGADIKLVEE
ncbi:UDP-N-acetylglucosamine 1-carboxyvinyltransferase [Candidatus Kuenenbacteria bacterium RIFCSPHIGHO2_02_FULL_39_13]|uniref:UDP-N-acetylglucosamine 1-carboxyvinyltransferase n=1 Tax=Candidatus Kuenenbacteria bacterium RIFCSPHIGHO2_02_FULL_39_13 TaxID=1798561 RepID=A0A1F6FNX4_9BACT|nr:MAG: UDP-N-acetylglucosamine 1-carboxyvinyltransferase [Candidatus Kuenenbacteria bacterium RIFCSPHIGHO2_02_FULL_39_13]